MLASNKAINTIIGLGSGAKKSMGNAVRDARLGLTHDKLPYYYGLLNKEARTGALKTANGNGNYSFRARDLSIGRVAGAAMAGYAGANVPYRLLSGGSLYRDKDGNRDMIGLPFV